MLYVPFGFCFCVQSATGTCGGSPPMELEGDRLVAGTVAIAKID